MTGLTTIAALPSAGGCASALPAEITKQPTIVMRAAYFDIPDEETPLVWPAIDLGMLEGRPCS